MAPPSSIGVVLLLTAAVGAAGFGQIRTSRHDRLFNGVYFVYEGKTTRESDLPPCPAATSVCSLVHLRFWLPVLSQRLCRCHEGQCPYRWTAHGDENTMRLNNRIQMKFCASVSALNQCAPEPSLAATLERRTEVGPLNLDDERRDVKVNCTCPYPSVHRKVSRSTGRGNTELTAYTCQKLAPCEPDAVCGHIRVDTYSTYYNCRCPAGNLCLFREQERRKVKREVEQLFYHDLAYVGECRPIHR